MNLENLKLYLPKFLSVESEKLLFENLKNFPKNIDNRLYTTYLKDTSIIFQGDGIKDMLVINLPNTEIKKANSIILSNTCDINSENKRNFPSQIVYAPIFNLSKYEKALKSQSQKTEKQIIEHIEAIKKQRITQIFYLPKIDENLDESIIFFDRVNNCSINYLENKKVKDERIFTLSDYGAYLFIFKMSIHFTRIQDKVDRNKEG